jgi:preprotein translocase subunit SecE
LACHPEVHAHIKEWCAVSDLEEKNELEEKRVKKAPPKVEKKGPRVNPVSRYLRETRGELRKVTWPTREESYRLTLIVLAVSTMMAAFLWFWDLVFSRSITWVIQLIVGA